MAHFCPADFDSGRCRRCSCSGLLEGLVRTVVLAWALVHNATSDRLWIVLCLTVSHLSRLEQRNTHANVFHFLRILRFILLTLAIFEYKYETDEDRVLAAEREGLLPR